LKSVPAAALPGAATRIESNCVLAAFLAQIAAFIAFLGEFWQFCFFPQECVWL
jgi:hypothetical protein